MEYYVRYIVFTRKLLDSFDRLLNFLIKRKKEKGKRNKEKKKLEGHEFVFEFIILQTVCKNQKEDVGCKSNVYT